MDRIQNAARMAHDVADALQARELPTSDSPVKWIVGGAVGGAVFLAVVAWALFFHFRRRKADKLEREKELLEMDDYGLADYSRAGGVTDDGSSAAWPQRGQSSLRAQLNGQGFGHQQQQQPGSMA